jgi:hypothetical protein
MLNAANDLILKGPLPRSEELLAHINRELTPNRLPLLIAIDGADGCGKSSLASWLAWQLEMPTVHLDLFMTATVPVQWLTADLRRAISHRLDRERPVIVEGILVLDATEQVDRSPGFLVFVTGKGSSFFSEQIKTYRSRKRPCGKADFVIRGAANPLHQPPASFDDSFIIPRELFFQSARASATRMARRPRLSPPSRRAACGPDAAISASRARWGFPTTRTSEARPTAPCTRVPRLGPRVPNVEPSVPGGLFQGRGNVGCTVAGGTVA